MRPCYTRDQLLELAANHLRDIQQRPQRTGRPQRLTTGPEDHHRFAERLTESTQQRRLTHTRLAPNQHQPPFRRGPDAGKQIAENRHTLRALYEFAHPDQRGDAHVDVDRFFEPSRTRSATHAGNEVSHAQPLGATDRLDLTARDWQRPEEGS